MKTIFKRILTYFLQGVLVVAPVVITVYLLYSLFTTIDNLIPIHIEIPLFNKPYAVKGLGFLIIIFGLIIIGYLSSNFITGRLFKFFDNLLEQVPGIKVVYSTIKDFFEAFAGNKRKFNKPVRVLIRKNPALWQIGFITQEDLCKICDEDLISVYLPHSYAVSGITMLVERQNVVAINNISAANAMKMAISGGVAGYEDEDEEEID